MWPETGREVDCTASRGPQWTAVIEKEELGDCSTKCLYLTPSSSTYIDGGCGHDLHITRSQYYAFRVT